MADNYQGLVGDTIIQIPSGYAFMSSLSDIKDVKMMAKSTDRFVSINDIFSFEENKIKKISLNNGMTISGSPNLKLLCSPVKPTTPSPELQWKTLSEIKSSDYVLIDLGYKRHFGSHNNLEEATSLAAGIALVSSDKKSKIIKMIKTSNIDIAKYSDCDYSKSIFIGSEEYLIKFFSTLLKFTKIYFLKSKSNTFRGLRIVLDATIAKYLQIILASSFGINSISDKQGLIIPPEFLQHLAAFFNQDKEIKMLNRFLKKYPISNNHTFIKVNSIKDIKDEKTYNIQLKSKNQTFSANSIYCYGFSTENR